MFYLLLTSESFRILLTTNMFYLILTTKTSYFSKTTSATYVRTHSQMSKPVSKPATRIAERKPPNTRKPPNSQMPGVGARATGTCT